MTGIEDVLIISVHGVIISLQQRGDQPGCRDQHSSPSDKNLPAALP
jgi:hypothetical protein